MTHPNKAKGCAAEREVCRLAEAHGLTAKRAWGSDGRSMGMAQGVDVLLQGRIKLQIKRVKALPKWLGMTSEVDTVALREDRGEWYAIVRLDDWLQERQGNEKE